MKKLIFTVCLTLISVFASAQNGGVKGFVYNSSNGDPIMFANIIVENSTLGTSTDINGFFIINKIPKGAHNLHIQSIGFADTVISIDITAGKTINIKAELRPESKTLETVEIYGRQESVRTDSRVSVKKISATDIQKMPSIGGQADIAQYIQVLPGVVFSGDQGGQLYIRGGSAIQNKVLLDGMVIYNPFHSIGLFSVFETDVIRNADIYTGGFNARYGGRLSSIMDITTKDGNKKTTSGKLSLSTFGGSAIIEGPIIADNDDKDFSMSYLLTAKNSYLSHTSESIYSYIDNELPYDFFDLYGKLSLTSKTGSKVNLFGFNFTDKVNGYKNIADFNWRNSGVGANFIIVPANSSSIVQAVLAYSDYTMEMDEKSTQNYQKSNISSFNGNLDITQFFEKNQLRYGIDLMWNTTNTVYTSDTDEDPDYSSDAGAYLIFKGLLGNFLYEPSIRFSYYASLSEISLEPRLSLKYNISDRFRLKAAVGKYSQSVIDTKSDRDIVNLFTGYLTAGPDLYGGVVSQYRGKAVDKFVEKSNHYIFGMEYDISKFLTVNAEVYYKTMTNLISINRDRLFDNDSSHSSFPDYLRKNFAVEEGTAWGGDISLKYSDGRLYVWAIYSLGKVEKKSETKTYFPHYDRRHNVNVLASYQLGLDRSWEVSARWNYGSGFPFTPTSGFGERLPLSDGLISDYVSTSGSLTAIYGELNGRRLPSYHRFDVSAKKRFNVFKHSIFEIEASVTNVYNRNNMFYYDRITSERVDQLPIMPSLGMTLRF
ncbi:MAG: TonB-dependent receptor [Bacteroidales bacterium]|nr:TonB-dependent receptor [Bacteroidales bacterium]